MYRTFYGVIPKVRPTAYLLLEEKQVDQWEEDDYISEDELKDAVVAMKLGKATGQDDNLIYQIK